MCDIQSQLSVAMALTNEREEGGLSDAVLRWQHVGEVDAR